MSEVEKYHVAQRIAAVIKNIVRFQLGVQFLVNLPCLEEIIANFLSLFVGITVL